MKKKELAIDEVAKALIEMKIEKAKMEKKEKDLKEAMMTFLSTQKDEEAHFHGWKFSRVEIERESFSLAKAREKIDGRTLAPYISVSKFPQIRMLFKSGSEN